MPAEYGPFQQSASNTAAHGMSSAEEAKYRLWDADPEYLQDPYDVAREAEARRREAEHDRRRALDHQLGYVTVPSMMVE